VITALVASLVLLGALVYLAYSSEPGTMKPGSGWQEKPEVQPKEPKPY
jgi:hypothetical protein